MVHTRQAPFLTGVIVVVVLASAAVRVQQRPGAPTPPANPLAEPFKGITTSGTSVPGLFGIRSTGVSTEPVRRAAGQFVASLTPEQRKRTTFPVDDDEWRLWYNVHRAKRQGVSFKEMDDRQRDAAFGLLGASLSARGLRTSRDVMRLNGYVAEVKNNFDEYGEGLYFLTVMGEPSDTEPWGWQLDGHHLVVNYFVLGDQVVMTPTFMGSEPVFVDTGKYAGTKVLQEEQAAGLAFVNALDDKQRQAAILEGTKTENKGQAQQFRDNITLDYQGIKASSLAPAQRNELRALIGLYVGQMRDGHAKVKMSEVEKHMADTWFLWIGETSPDAVFYYRIHSPVILIEFDHQTPVAFRGENIPQVPTRQHIHTVVRTPNGNDYGKDLLRRHYEKHKHDPSHGHNQ